ncbi:hypothetical protein ABPG77_005359 [Micractinium sp. CCAP 211/92]
MPAPLAAPPSPSPPAPAYKACPGNGTWQNASATQFWSYPPCCSDPTVDQTECAVYSGCRWEGLFSAFGDSKKSLDWVKQNNIAAFFAPPNADNEKNWDKKWKKKKLRVRNPLTCQVRARAGTPLSHFEQKTGRKRTCALEGRAGCTAAPPLPNLPDFFPPHAQSMTVTIYDTCDDNDCPDPSGSGPGCCTAHANMNGGNLVDLEVCSQ